MMRLAFALVVLALVVPVEPAFGHAEAQHLLGYVTTVSGSSITIETLAKETKTVSVTPATKFWTGNQPASLKDVKVGDRIVIYAHEEDEKLEATEVRFATPAAPAKPK